MKRKLVQAKQSKYLLHQTILASVKYENDYFYNLNSILTVNKNMDASSFVYDLSS